MRLPQLRFPVPAPRARLGQTADVTSPPPPGATGYGAIVTGEAVALELRPARLPSRLLAAGIDLAAQTVVLIALLTILGAAFAGSGGIDQASGYALVIALLVTCLLGYPVAMTVLARGRTLGKLALGLRVVRSDGGPVLFRQVFVRELVGLVVEKPGLLLGLPAVVVALAREDGRRLGDLAAGTLVVSERITGRVLPPVAMPPPLAGWAAALDLSRLTDATALRARQVLLRAHDLRPEAREAVGGRLVAEVAAAVGPVPPGAPGWAFLAAVLAERRRRDEIRLAERARAAARVPGQVQAGYAAPPPPGGFGQPGFGYPPGAGSRPGGGWAPLGAWSPRPVGMAAYDGPLDT